MKPARSESPPLPDAGREGEPGAGRTALLCRARSCLQEACASERWLAAVATLEAEEGAFGGLVVGAVARRALRGVHGRAAAIPDAADPSPSPALAEPALGPATPAPTLALTTPTPTLALALERICHERLHSGRWSEVRACWRDAYAAAALLRAWELCLEDEEADVATWAERVQRELDLGLMLGAGALAAETQAASERLGALWRAARAERLASANVSRASEKRRRLSDSGSCQSPASSPSRALPPPGSLGACPESRPLRCWAELPSLERFWASCMGLGEASNAAPALLRGVVREWPAVRRWAEPGYLESLAGWRTVPVEVGRDYLSPDFSSRLVRFADVVRQLNGERGGRNLTGEEEDSLEASASGPSPGMYLAQHCLFEQLPELARDVWAPEYCSLSQAEEPARVNAWCGPAGTTTPLHRDPPHNLLCQALGSKYVRLYRPEAGAALDCPAVGMHTNSSRVDLDLPLEALHACWPALEGEPHWDGVLEPGDALYVPPGWWHFVRSLAPSFSVSYWWE